MQQTRQGYIYALTSKTTGKVYVGQTVQRLNDRLTEHWYFAERGSRTHFACALRKYGLDDFVLEVLETSTAPDLNARRCGYNMSAGGGGRKLVWRMRHDVRGCAPHSEAA